VQINALASSHWRQCPPMRASISMTAQDAGQYCDPRRVSTLTAAALAKALMVSVPETAFFLMELNTVLDYGSRLRPRAKA
jgi:hypothetical protein